MQNSYLERVMSLLDRYKLKFTVSYGSCIKIHDDKKDYGYGHIYKDECEFDLALSLALNEALDTKINEYKTLIDKIFNDRFSTGCCTTTQMTRKEFCEELNEYYNKVLKEM